VRYELVFYIPDDDILRSHLRENLKSYIPIKWVLGQFYPWVKLFGREAEHLPLSSAKVRKDGAVPQSPIGLQ
jgi:hypothetical protein